MGIQEQEPKDQDREPKCEYTPLVEIDKRGYWFGNEYRGPYYARLDVATESLTEILRAGNFPPIVLSSEGYSPEERGEPMIVGGSPDGTAYMGKGNRKTIKRGFSEMLFQYYSLETTEESGDSNNERIPIGWKINIIGDKIYDDVKGDAKEFAKKFNIQLKQSLIHISLLEILARD